MLVGMVVGTEVGTVVATVVAGGAGVSVHPAESRSAQRIPAIIRNIR
jgi:hypothetical protein